MGGGTSKANYNNKLYIQNDFKTFKLAANLLLLLLLSIKINMKRASLLASLIIDLCLCVANQKVISFLSDYANQSHARCFYHWPTVMGS